MSDIVVLGSANMDLVVTQPRLPRPGETMFGTAFHTVPGGKGLNQAVAAARAGARVSFVGAVGRDAHGAELRALMTREGIDTAHLAELPVATGTAHISVLDGGENAITVVSGANAAVLELDEPARASIAAARYLVMQFELPQRVLLEGVRAARSSGVTTVLTPAPVQRPEPGLLQKIDILVPNAAEACALAGREDPLDAARALSEHGGTVIVTRGPQGAIVASGGGIVADIPARVVRAVDTTAAGDTFVGVLVARLASGADLESALGTASAAASIAVTRSGATSSMPTLAEIEAVLRA
jgi:ribokinase